MVCQWAFRTFSPKNDTEISYRGVPGIRVPGLEVDVLESRVWKDLDSTKNNEQSASPCLRSALQVSLFLLLYRGYIGYFSENGNTWQYKLHSYS